MCLSKRNHFWCLLLRLTHMVKFYVRTSYQRPLTRKLIVGLISRWLRILTTTSEGNTIQALICWVKSKSLPASKSQKRLNRKRLSIAHKDLSQTRIGFQIGFISKVRQVKSGSLSKRRSTAWSRWVLTRNKWSWTTSWLWRIKGL